MLPRFRHAAVLPVLCLSLLLNAGAQTPSAPPMIVQVPFITVGAGNIVSGASSTSKATACTGYANASGTNYGDGCPANQAGVSAPWGAAVDKWGNVYFSDEGHLYVRVIYAGATSVNGVANPATAMIKAANTSLGISTTLAAGDVYALAGGLTAGNVGTCNGGAVALSSNGSGCPATDSYLKGPYGPAVDGAGNVFIVDKSNSLVYVVIASASSDAAQLVTLENPTVTSPAVGSIYAIVNGGGGYTDGVLALSGKVHGPYGIAVDASENVYIADGTNNLVRMINGPGVTNSSGTSNICASNSCAPGYIHAIAGLYATCTSSSCTALSAAPSANVSPLGTGFDAPMGIQVDGSGNIYIGDNSAGTSSVPATVRVIYAGGTSNPAANLICTENSAASYCGSTPSLTAGYVYTIAGSGNGGSSGKGAGLLATNSGVAFDRIEGLGLDGHGNLYIMDYGSHSELAEVSAGTGILTFLSADGEPSSTAKYTVADYCSNGTAAGSGPTAQDEYGDGCPAPQSNADNGEGNIGVDPSGNLYFADSGDSLLRKLTFNGSFPATTVGSPAATQNVAFLLETGSTGDTVSSVSPVIVSTQGTTASSEFTNAGAGDTCSSSTTLAGLTSSSTNTADTVCVVPVIFKPAVAGARSGAVQITGTISSVPTLLGTVFLNGIGNGASLAIDPGTGSTLGNGSTPMGVTTDSAGNVYVSYNNGTIYRLSNSGGTASGIEIAGGYANPRQVAIDGAGNLYLAESGTNEIVEFAGASTSSSVITGTVVATDVGAPTGVAVDASGNLYIADTLNRRVLLQAADNGAQTVLGSGFDDPNSVAVDASGNVYVTDQGLSAIIKLTMANGVVTQQSTVLQLSSDTPWGVAVDAAGDLYYSDSAKGEVVEIPVTGTTAVIASGFGIPGGIALDPKGNLYVADSNSTAGISYFNRTAATLPVIPDGRSGDATITNIGNTSYSGGISGNSDLTASTDFTFAAGSSNGCNTPTSLTLAAGNNCDLNITANTSTAVDTVTFTGGSTLALSSGTSVAVGTNSLLSIPITSIAYGASLNGTVTVTPASGSLNPTGTVTLLSGSTPLGSCTLNNPTGNANSCNFSLTNVNANVTLVTASYGGDSNSSASLSNGISVNIAQASTATSLSLTSSASLVEGSVFTGTATVTPTAASGIVSVYLDGGMTAATTCTLSGGTCSWSLSGVAIGGHTLTATFPGNTDYVSSSTTRGTSIAVTAPPQAPTVATGDSRTVTEPSFPAVCAQLSAALTSVNDDIPASVDATITNPDGARIQAALASCSTNHPGQAVELSIDGSGHNAFLTGPLSMPSNVTLLVDPGVYVYFSRNVQDYDKVAGTHTCGTVNSSSATSSCQPLIDIPGTSTNVGIMGFGKLDGRGGDTLINAISPYQGQSWWGLSTIANNGGNQQNPRFVQIDTGASNITMYKITLRNSPLFHISTTGAASGFTAWDIKIITPTSSRNTDGIDPGNAQNFTITRSWISDGDDNIAVGAAGTTAPSANISVTNNRFFAGHGESIGSYTSAGVSNILFDSNMSSGNGTANVGSASITGTADSNSTGLRIKSGYDRGGLVTNIQYSNSCYQDHKAEIVFSPNYEATTGAESPNLTNILMQNLTFLTAGTAQFTGTSNNSTVYPLGVTLDNVSFPSTFPSSEFSPAPTNASLIYGPGDVSSDFISDYATFVGANLNTAANNIQVSTTFPPTCTFTYIAPELTGPNGRPQTLTFGQNATAVVILTPAVGGAAYPTGTVTLTDALTSNTTTVTLTGTTDTISIPLGVLAVGAHSFTATYSGDSNYTLTNGQTAYSTTSPYVITVNAGSLGNTTTGLSGVPTSTTFGTAFTATATVTGSNPTGTVEFLVSGGGAVGSYVYATAALTSSPASGTATASINLPFNTTAYSITAIYSGDSVNASSTSSIAPVTITQGTTITALTANVSTSTLGHPISITASVTSVAGVPAGTINFTYSTTLNGTQIALGSATLVNGSASDSVDLPIGTDYVTATYAAGGSFAGSASTPMSFTVTQPTITGLPNNPIALPYTMTTIAGGSGLSIPSSGNMACTGATDKYGDGCQGTAISFTAGDDMRAVVADPFGNVYLSDISATLVRRITPNGVISDFAGLVSGTACVPTATTGCTPTLVSIGKARGLGTDAAGNIYIANYTGNQVFEVKISTGLLYLVAGNGTGGYLGDGSTATSAEINQSRGAWGDSIGNVYIADTANNRIRVVDALGNIHTFAGNGTASSNGDGASATAAEINNPQGVIADANLNVYIADSSGGKIRVVCVTCGTNSPLDALLAKLGITSPVNGDIYTVAGSGPTSTFSYTAPVLSTGVSMSPQKMAFDASGNLYISDGNGFIWLLDFHTGYLRAIASNSATLCATKTDSYGDGCPATQASFGSNGGNGMGVGADALGNIYISDGTNLLIRKVITGLQSPSTATSSTATLPVEIHFTAGDGPASSNPLAYSSSEWALGTPACTTNADTTKDCLLTSSFTPAVPGARSTPLTITSSAGNGSNLALTGLGLGAGTTLDPAMQTSFGTGLQVAGVATDTAGNVYVADTNSKKLLRFAPSALTQGASAASTTLATLTAPGPVAVDARGFVYVGDTSTGLITQISPSGTTSTLTLKLTTPAGLAVDALNNLYVSDSSAHVVYQLDPITGAAHSLATGTLVAPAGLAIDPSGNLLIADPGAAAIYRFNQQSGITTAVSSTAVKPSAVVTDAAGNLLVADTADILAVPASSHSSSFTAAVLAPSALAIDSAGNLYTGSGGSVFKLTRTQGRVQFAAASSTPTTVNLLDSGNQALQLSSISQTDTADYSLAGTASTDCTLTGTLPTALAIGGVCALKASYTPTTYLSTTDTATFNGNFANAALSTPSAVQLVLTGPSTPPAASIGISFLPAAPVYGQSVTVTATLSGSSVTPAGTVVFTVDSTNTTITVANGVANLVLNGLTGGTHKISAVYTSTNGFASATASAVTLTVTTASTTATVTSNNNPALLQSIITLTAKVTSSAGTPTQTVTFLDGSTSIGTGTLSGGQTTLNTSTLAAGTHSITVSYGGDTNFAPSTSTALAQLVVDFNFSISSPTVVVSPGGVAVFTFTVTPVGSSSFPTAVNLAASGLPAGATSVFSPATLAAGAGATTVTLTVDIPQTQASARPYTARPGSQLAGNSRGSKAGGLTARLMPFTLALLLLPFAGRLRRTSKRLGRMFSVLLLLAAGAATLAGIGGCGSSSGYFAQQQQTYTITVTGTAGALSHSATVTLTVE
jgi:sugar lactone lactonase YvrE